MFTVGRDAIFGARPMFYSTHLAYTNASRKYRAIKRMFRLFGDHRPGVNDPSFSEMFIIEGMQQEYTGHFLLVFRLNSRDRDI